MRMLFFTILIMPSILFAGTTEYNLINFTNCKMYNLSNEDIVPSEGDQQEIEKAYRIHDETVKKLLVRYGTDRSPFSFFDYSTGKYSYAVCKTEWVETSTAIMPKSFYCDGDASFPLPQLSCSFETSKCKIKLGNNQIRLYGVNTSECEDGSCSQEEYENIDFNNDIRKLKSLCPNIK